MITKRTVAIPTVLEDGQIQLREDTVFEEDGVEVIRTHRRRVLEPGDNVTTESPRVRDICNIVWTPAIIADFEQRRERPL